VPTLYPDTNLVFVDGPGPTKLKLNDQHQLVRWIVQDAIENLRALLLFNNAFPDAPVTFTLAKGALNLAAENREADGGVLVQHQLQDDEEYLFRLSTLVHYIISEMTSLRFIGSCADVYAVSVVKSRIAAMRFAPP
jgi:hypothetical protein